MVSCELENGGLRLDNIGLGSEVFSLTGDSISQYAIQWRVRSK